MKQVVNVSKRRNNKMSLQKWLLKQGKKVKDVGEKAVKDSVEGAKKGASKIVEEGKKASKKWKGAEQEVGESTALAKYTGGNKKKLVGAAAAAAGVGAGAAYAASDDDEPKKKKKRPYIED
jgi:hypothetical protein